MRTSICLIAFWSALILARADGVVWPDDQLLPTFSKPATNLDCIDVSSASNAESDLFASLEGIVNRTQPRIICVSGGDGEGKFTWVDLHNLSYTIANGYSVILKYRSELNGLVVTDPGQPDTLNLATTIAGINNELICDPSLLSTLTNAPYNLTIGVDLRGRFMNKYQVYNYLYANYWSQCTHRIFTGLYTDLHGELRDYCVAVKSAVVWLDPGNSGDATTLSHFFADMTANQSIYMGWWPSEANGLNWIAQYGVPVIASDFFRNGTVYSGVPHAVDVPPIPPPPPLQNKVYVSLILSDGDNIQYMQHVMKMRWDTSARGSIPIGWTATPLSSAMDPMMLNYYWSTATTNDCLISGPSGAGYTHMQNWGSANLAGFAKISNGYLQKSGLRVITIWERVNTGVVRAFATNCPTLLGLTDQSGYNYTTVNLGLRTIGLAVAYSSSTSAIISGIQNAAQSWNGTSPMFVAAQANTWDLQPSDLVSIANALDPNKYVIVRPDHLFMLANRVYGQPEATTGPAIKITPTTATLCGSVVPQAATAAAWMEWGTNSSYGSATATTYVSGTSPVPVKAAIAGLHASTIYHYRIAVSNALGIVWGTDKVFTTGGRVKAWGNGAQGQTNVPPGLTNAVRISGGAYHGLALKNDGDVIAWGSDTLNQSDVPAGLTNVIDVAGGFQHSLALKADGTVTAWGSDGYGQTNVPVDLTNVVGIAAGGFHNLALKSDGTVTAWGYDNYGQTNVPMNLTDAVAIAAGRYHSLALKSDSTVTAWGYDALGQTDVPAGLNHVVAISAGDYHSLAVKSDETALPSLQPSRRWVADDIGGADGSAVGTWVDEANSIDASQSTASHRPTLRYNVINGHSAVHFSSSGSQYLTVAAADSPISAAGSFTLIVVFKTSTPGNVSSLFYQNTGLLGCEQPNVVHDWAFCLNGTQLGAGLGGGANGCSSDLGLYGGVVADGNPHIGIYLRSGETISLYVDGVMVATQTSLCTAARGNYPFRIGAMTANSYFFNGDIAEIQLYDRALDSREIVGVNEQLAATYDIGGAAGQVVTWGSKANNLANLPSTLAGISTIASGSDFNLALANDGVVSSWGNNSQGQLDLPVGLTNVASVSGGMGFGLAIGDQAPVAMDQTASGFVNHDLLLALTAGNPDCTPLDYSIESLPASGALYQCLAGGRGAPINAAGALVSDANGRIVFAPGDGETGSPYASFQFKVENGTCSSAPAQVTINIGLPSVPEFKEVSLAQQSAEGLNLDFSGNSNATYTVWAATNLADWINLGRATEIQPGQYEFFDSAMASWPQRFYRISAP